MNTIIYTFSIEGKETNTPVTSYLNKDLQQICAGHIFISKDNPEEYVAFITLKNQKKAICFRNVSISDKEVILKTSRINAEELTVTLTRNDANLQGTYSIYVDGGRGPGFCSGTISGQIIPTPALALEVLQKTYDELS